MIFDYIIGRGIAKGIHHEKKRIAVRAVIRRHNKLLMVSNNKGDIKFPGGGVDKDESHKEALAREIMEETGYMLTVFGDKMGRVIERREVQHDAQTFSEMTSYYYQCEVRDEVQKQSLDAYEKALDFEARWVDVTEAININQAAFNNNKRNPWVERELYVLNQLKG